MKPKTPISRVDRLILDEASEWFVDFRVGDVDAAARERFDEWLRRSPEHIRAYIEIAKTYVELPALKLAGKTDVDVLIAYARCGDNVVSLHPGERAGESASMPASPIHHPSEAGRVVRHPRARRRLLAVACVLVAALLGTVWWQSERYSTYATDIGERRSVTLADGSTVDLNARSKLRIEFTKDKRLVELLDGQALFQVAKDKDRPFIVASGDATVRAVGTQFDVYRKANGTTVTVLEGRVAVYSAVGSSTVGSADAPAAARLTPGSLHPSVQTSPHSPAMSLSPGHSGPAPADSPGLVDPSGSAPIFVSAGEQVTVTPAQVLAAPARADVAAATAWMERRLIFDGSRLSDVVQEFNRYNKRQLVIDGAKLADFHVSGVYSSTDPASLIRFLREQPGMKITEDGNEVRIESP